GFKVESGRDQPELIQAAERREIGRVEGSVVQIEVFCVESVGTSIIRRPRSISPPPHREPGLHPQLRRALVACIAGMTARGEVGVAGFEARPLHLECYGLSIPHGTLFHPGSSRISTRLSASQNRYASLCSQSGV